MRSNAKWLNLSWNGLFGFIIGAVSAIFLAHGLVIITLVFVAIAAIGLLVISTIELARRRQHNSISSIHKSSIQCEYCGYDLSGSPRLNDPYVLCPECGGLTKVLPKLRIANMNK